VTRCHIALASAWLALSLTLTMLSFPVLMQGSSVCDGVDDDDSFWEPALVERDGLRVADEALVGTDSHICKPVSGIDYEVRLSYSPNPNRATNVPVTVSGYTGGGSKKLTVNQKQPPAIDHLFTSLGAYRFDAGAKATVEITTANTDGHVIVDAVQLVPAK